MAIGVFSVRVNALDSAAVLFRMILDGLGVGAGQRRRGCDVSGQDAFAEGLLLFGAGHSSLLGM